MAKAEKKTLAQIIAETNKEWDGDILHKGVSEYEYERIPFTSPRLNYITFGGLPKGKLIEFYGEEHGGKTTTALDSIANYQHTDDGRTVLYLDAENTLDVVWANKLGVDVDDMIIMNPEAQGAEKLFDKTLRIIETGEIGFVVIDSFGVMLSNQAYEKSIEDKTYGGIAMALTNFSKQAEVLCHKTKCTLIGINQMRADMNSAYGGLTTTGGYAWRHNVSVRMEFRKGYSFDSKYNKLSRSAESPVGNIVDVYMSKNKTCPPTRRNGFYTLRYDSGIDYLYDLTEVCLKYDVIYKSSGSSWYELKDVHTGETIKKLQGQASVSEFLADEKNIDILKMYEDYLDEKVRTA